MWSHGMGYGVRMGRGVGLCMKILSRHEVSHNGFLNEYLNGSSASACPSSVSPLTFVLAMRSLYFLSRRSSESVVETYDDSEVDTSSSAMSPISAFLDRKGSMPDDVSDGVE